ncbi:MAG TPA: hypothetical protein PK847_07795 [Candidatus Sumerlaeota bacterium]|nr:hypothetical protein [Candidatus Sumerlaeota bacterium]HOR27106.1 hypothetical protein [Candidatus Sumerlaeota bacterium]
MTAPRNTSHAEPTESTRHERGDAPARPLLIGLGVIVLALIASMAGLAGLIRVFDRFIPRQELGPPHVLDLGPSAIPPAPTPPLLTSRRELDEARAADLALLSTYGWVDRDQRIVRLPIDRAMALVAERGLPAFAGDPASRDEFTTHAVRPAPPRPVSPFLREALRGRGLDLP